jgi:glycosyltransferase involved in cell wall biosynthesis
MLYVTKFESDPTKSYTRCALQWIKALQTQNVSFELRPLDNMLDWSRMPSWAQPLKDYFTTSRSDNGCALVHALPTDLVATRLYKSKNISIGVTALETSRLPLWVGDALNESYKGLIVPSAFNKESLLRSGVKIPVEVVPHALGDWWLSDDKAPPAEKDPAIYTFGYVGYWNARKNPQMLLDAYVEAFPEPRKDVALLIKTFGMPQIPAEVAARDDIWIYSEDWTEAQMLWGFGLIDCYVSPHRGEGFGLTLAQAAAKGKPVVYTDYSAPREWLSATEGHYPLQTEVVEVTESETLLSGTLSGKGLLWGAPDKAHLVETLRELAQRRPAQGFSGQALSDFRSKLTWARVGETMVDAVESILGKPLPRRESAL